MISINRSRPSADILRQTNLSEMISRREQQIATGNRLERGSDDPVAWQKINGISAAQTDISAWLRNIDRASSMAAQAETNIGSIANNLARLNELLVQGSSDSLSQIDRETIAAEVEAIGISIDNFIHSDDSFGQPLFTVNEALEIPIGPSKRVTPAPEQSRFDGLAPAVTAIASAIRSGDPTMRVNAFETLNREIVSNSELLSGQGQVTRALDNQSEELEVRRLDLAVERSSLADTDLTTAITDVRRLLVNLEAAQATFARINQSSLFDLIR